MNQKDNFDDDSSFEYEEDDSVELTESSENGNHQENEQQTKETIDDEAFISIKTAYFNLQQAYNEMYLLFINSSDQEKQQLSSELNQLKELLDQTFNLLHHK